MSWSCYKSGTIEEVKAAVEKEHGNGHMPAEHKAAIDAALGSVPEFCTSVTLNSFGHKDGPDQKTHNNNLSVTVNAS